MSDMPTELTLRDYFAAMALQGLISSGGARWDDYVAELSYQYADYMIQQRKKGGSNE